MNFKIYGDIDSQLATEFLEEVKNQYVAGEDISIEINSFGGFLNSATQIADVLRFLQSQHSKITILNTGDVMSAATIIWLICDQRIWDPQYSFLIHNPYMQDVTGDATHLIEQAIELTEVEGDIVELYCNISGKTPDEIHELMVQERPMTLDELIDFQFITGYKK